MLVISTTHNIEFSPIWGDAWGCRCWGYSSSSDITSEDQVCHDSVEESAWGLNFVKACGVLAWLHRTQWLHLFVHFFIVFHVFPVYNLHICTVYMSWSVTSHQYITAHDMLMCPCSPPFHSRLRRRHRLNCHILAAIEASNSLTRVRCPFSFWSHSSRVSGCRRFHDDLSGYCPHHQWSRWAKCTDWLSTAPWLGSQLRGNADPTGLWRVEKSFESRAQKAPKARGISDSNLEVWGFVSRSLSIDLAWTWFSNCCNWLRWGLAPESTHAAFRDSSCHGVGEPSALGSAAVVVAPGQIWHRRAHYEL